MSQPASNGLLARLHKFAIPICGFLLITGAVAAVVAVNANGKLEQGNTAPASIKGEASMLMIQRAHGTCTAAVQSPLRWKADVETGDRISCFNRHYAERAGSFQSTYFLKEQKNKTTIFYDSVTGKPLFIAPMDRTYEEFIAESKAHGWPSFRDAEVISEDVRVLEDGEVVSKDGTHLGHNLPDSKGNRYCINLVSVAGLPEENDDADVPSTTTPHPRTVPLRHYRI